MRWSILIPSVVTRLELLNRLIERLKPQAHKGIEVIIHWNNFEKSIGKVRHELIKDATGEYISFIDDDDLVSEDYCKTIYPLLDGVDYIGFKLDFYDNGKKQLPTIHSLKNKGWFDDDIGFYRQVTLVNPIRRELALRSGIENSDYSKNIPEEKVYADTLSKLAKTEHFIDRVLYTYLQTDDHVFKRTVSELTIPKRPALPTHFRFCKGSTHEG